MLGLFACENPPFPSLFCAFSPRPDRLSPERPEPGGRFSWKTGFPGMDFFESPCWLNLVRRKDKDSQTKLIPKKESLSITGTLMGDRGTSWSITINNPTEEEVKVSAPGWKLEGQYEVGEEGTRHFQGLLSTPQVRFAAVKKVFPRAHIELARNKKALQAYVHKAATRVEEYKTVDNPNVFNSQKLVTDLWDPVEWQKRITDPQLVKKYDYNYGALALGYVDTLVETLIEGGARGLEYISVNPMWRSSWSRHWRAIVARNKNESLSIKQNGDAQGGDTCAVPASQSGSEEAASPSREEGAGCVD